MKQVFIHISFGILVFFLLVVIGVKTIAQNNQEIGESINSSFFNIKNDTTAKYHLNTTILTHQEIDEISEIKTFSVFPNPTFGNINISSDDFFDKDLKIELVNLNGQVIFSSYFNSSKTDYNIDLPDISKGLYIIKIQCDDFIKTKKIVIE
ncbi:MAG: T9SS type A sorting domain-containing protein [Chlorobi bacterium]|nr:T9SS type A sorting domain-containing protein [Chlorobiota bacterium]